MEKVAVILALAISCWVDLGYCDENTLYQTLINTAGYNNKVRPLLDHTKTVTTTIQFELFSIVDLDERNQILTVFGFFFVEWTDEHLKWDPAVQANIESMVLPPTVVWLPDIGIENSANTFYHETFRKDFHVRLYYTGVIQWSHGGQIETRCDLDMTYFPFDKQICTIQVENWAYHGNEVLLRNSSHEIQLDNFEQNGIWNVDKTESNYNNVYIASSGPQPYPEVNFVLYLSRKPNYYILNLIVPCILIILVALAVFWLPAESGEKVSLGVTILLAFSVFQIVLADSTPANSDYTPVLGQLVIGIMILSSVSVLTSILILYLYHKSTSTRVPEKVKLLFFRGLATAMCMRGDVPEGLSGSVAPADTTNEKTDAEKSKAAWPVDVDDCPPILADHDLQKLANDLSYIAQRVRKQDKNDDIAEEWRVLARILDRLLFWTATIIVLIILFVFLLRRDPSY